MSGVVVVGATGQCKVIEEIIFRMGVGYICAIVDENPDAKNPFPNKPFFKGEKAFKDLFESLKDLYSPKFFVVAIGNPRARRRREIAGMLMKKKLEPLSIIDPSAFIASSVKIGKGVQIHQGVIVQPFTTIGDFCILNTGCQVDHDGKLADGVEIGPGAILCGTIEVGENTWIGAGSTIRHSQKIGEDVIIGCGSVVVDNLYDGNVYVGNPAKFLKENDKR